MRPTARSTRATQRTSPLRSPTRPGSASREPLWKAPTAPRPGVFGSYVSVYPMRRAQEDRATVPIYYESRQIPLDIADPEQLAEVEEVLEAEEQDAASKLVTAWAKLEKVVGARDRVERLADDVARAFPSPMRSAQRQGDGRCLFAADSGRVDRSVAGALRRGGRYMCDLRSGDRSAHSLAFQALEARAARGCQATSATSTTRSASWSSRTCG